MSSTRIPVQQRVKRECERVVVFSKVECSSMADDRQSPSARCDHELRQQGVVQARTPAASSRFPLPAAREYQRSRYRKCIYKEPPPSDPSTFLRTNVREILLDAAEDHSIENLTLWARPCPILSSSGFLSRAERLASGCYEHGSSRVLYATPSNACATSLCENLRSGFIAGHTSTECTLPRVAMAGMLWSYARVPLFAFGGIAGLQSSTLYYYQK